MRKKIWIIIILACFVFPGICRGEPQHWAGAEIDRCEAYGIKITGYDCPAEIELQEKLFRLADLPLQPTANMSRYQLIAALVEHLQLPTLTEQELPEILDDPKEKQMVTRGQYIAVVDDWIYFVNEVKNNAVPRLHKMKLDGSEETLLCEDRVANPTMAGNWIFYNNLNESSKIYRISLDGQVREKI